MLRSRRPFGIRLLILIVCFSLTTPCAVSASIVPEVQPCASYYLSCYQTYVCPVGNGEIQVWFDVIGAGTQDELGTLSIMVYESTDNKNWTWKDAYLHEDYSNMLKYNTAQNMSYVSYQGVAGRYYKAYVCIWGGSDGNGDTRYVWTSSQRAT